MATGTSHEVQQAYLVRPGNLAVGACYVIGANGNDNPGAMLMDPVLSNASATVDYRVGATLAGVIGTRYSLVRAGYVVPLPGHFDQLVVYNVTGAAGVIVPEVAATSSHLQNSGGGSGSAVVGQRLVPSSATFEHAFYIAAVANTATSSAWVVPPQNSITVAAVRVWSGTPCTSAGGTYLLTVTATTAAGVSRSLISSFNLETISAATLTATTLSTTTADLAVRGGETITVTATSNNADLVIGDVAVSVEFTLT